MGSRSFVRPPCFVLNNLHHIPLEIIIIANIDLPWFFGCVFGSYFQCSSFPCSILFQFMPFNCFHLCCFFSCFCFQFFQSHPCAPSNMVTFHGVGRLNLTIMVDNLRAFFIFKQCLCAMFAFQLGSLHIFKDILYDFNNLVSSLLY